MTATLIVDGKVFPALQMHKGYAVGVRFDGVYSTRPSLKSFADGASALIENSGKLSETYMLDEIRFQVHDVNPTEEDPIGENQVDCRYLEIK